jgi:hypothetical protein
MGHSERWPRAMGPSPTIASMYFFLAHSCACRTALCRLMVAMRTALASCKPSAASRQRCCKPPSAVPRCCPKPPPTWALASPPWSSSTPPKCSRFKYCTSLFGKYTSRWLCWPTGLLLRLFVLYTILICVSLMHVKCIHELYSLFPHIYILYNVIPIFYIFFWEFSYDPPYFGYNFFSFRDLYELRSQKRSYQPVRDCAESR